MKRYLIILALCGAAQAGHPYGDATRSLNARLYEPAPVLNCVQGRWYQAEQEDCEEQIEALQAQINAQNSTVIISGGVSRDVQVITPGRIIDLRNK